MTSNELIKSFEKPLGLLEGGEEILFPRSWSKDSRLEDPVGTIESLLSKFEKDGEDEEESGDTYEAAVDAASESIRELKPHRVFQWINSVRTDLSQGADRIPFESLVRDLTGAVDEWEQTYSDFLREKQ